MSGPAVQQPAGHRRQCGVDAQTSRHTRALQASLDLVLTPLAALACGRSKLLSSTLDDKTHLHVSLDVDFLDPVIPPASAPRCRAVRPTARRSCAWRCSPTPASSPAIDVMDLNPALDLRNKTAGLAAALIEGLFGKCALLRL